MRVWINKPMPHPTKTFPFSPLGGRLLCSLSLYCNLPWLPGQGCETVALMDLVAPPIFNHSAHSSVVLPLQDFPAAMFSYFPIPK